MATRSQKLEQLGTKAWGRIGALQEGYGRFEYDADYSTRKRVRLLHRAIDRIARHTAKARKEEMRTKLRELGII